MRRFREGGDPVDVVIITPEPGQHKDVGQRLLAVIEDMGLPGNTLRWVTWPTTGFAVPLEVYARFETDEEDDDGDEAAEAKPKKRGRPRKKQPVQGTDNEIKEE